MLDWELDVADVEAALAGGETIEEYEDGSRLMLGRSGVQALHVVVNDVLEADATVVITVYEPDPGKWDAAFRHRRQP
jgi:hypothetical protein